MAKEIDRYYVVKILVDGEMLNDSATKYDSKEFAVRRAEKCASMGEYAEVREVVCTERMLERFEASN